MLQSIYTLYWYANQTTTTMYAHILTPTSNLERSLEFYTSLNFKVISQQYPTLVTDGSAIIEIDPDHYKRPGIKLYGAEIEKLVSKVETLAELRKIDEGYLLSDPSGTFIYLSNEDYPYDIEREDPYSILGNFSGISLEVIDTLKTIAIWERLGFSDVINGQGWVTLTHPGGLQVSIMPPGTCPHLFFNPSLTYFNGGHNLEVIEQIKAQHIPIVEEITYFNEEGIADNVIIRDPGGYGFFIFND